MNQPTPVTKYLACNIGLDIRTVEFVKETNCYYFIKCSGLKGTIRIVKDRAHYQKILDSFVEAKQWLENTQKAKNSTYEDAVRMGQSRLNRIREIKESDTKPYFS